MSTTTRQIFQTDSRLRWRTFQWLGRLFLFFLLLMIPVAIFTLARGIKPQLPVLGVQNNNAQKLTHPTVPSDLNAKELKKYKGFSTYLAERQKLSNAIANSHRPDAQRVRAAFYVDWDPQSFYSLQQNIDRINIVIPEWFFIDPTADTLTTKIDTAALNLMKQHSVKIIPLINNVDPDKGDGDFNSHTIHRILNDRLKRARLINDIINKVQQYKLQGINIDFEELHEKSDEPLITFQKELYARMHPADLIVTQDIMPSNEDFNINALSQHNDYLFLMAYDEHYSESVPGPVSGQQWVEKVLDETAKDIPSNKIVLCLAGYGYDWAGDDAANTVTYQEALANAQQYNATIYFDDNTYNNHYTYTDGDSIKHQVYFCDAATNFNTMRFADEYGVAGTALWRLGSEDSRLWKFYARNLDNETLQKTPFNFACLQSVGASFEKPDYIGDGEILNVLTAPQQGDIGIVKDPAEGIITGQDYKSLPTKYVIRKYGNVNKQVILTFDDGPDPTYTPQVLDILKKEKVPATFFIVGIQAENNLPLLQRIHREGHEIGNHTFTHPNMAVVGTERAATEMEATRLLIEAVTGRSTVLFRAPYNADAEPTTYAELKPVALSKQKNYYTVGESIDPEDWEKNISADSIYHRVIAQYEANPEKGIILLHDAGGDRSATVAALPRIIQYFKARNIQFTTVANLLHTTKDVVMPPVHNQLVSLNGSIFHVGYWLEHFLSAAFWVAIVLGFVRIAMMAVMAILQKIKSRKDTSAPFIPATQSPLVSIIVPAYNEELNAVNTIHSLLQQDYSNLNIIFVDDGSKDTTYKKVSEAFKDHPRVQVFTKSNGGKASALNFGIAESKAEFLICIDADTQLKTDAVSQLMRSMLSQNGGQVTGAVAGNVKVGNERNILTKWQSIEYTTAQNFDRRAFDLINGITVVPGAIGAFRKEAIEKAGSFTTDTLAEDCDLTIRILRSGYKVITCNEAIAITEAPESIKQFMKQRFRWSYGIMQAFWKHRDACFNPRYKGLGMVSLPNILLFQIVLPVLAPLADLVLVLSLIWNRHDQDSLMKIATYYSLFLIVDILVSVIAFAFEKEKPYKLVWLIPQRFVYRQLMYVILYRSIRKAIKGETQGWGVLKRTGNLNIQQFKVQGSKSNV